MIIIAWRNVIIIAVKQNRIQDYTTDYYYDNVKGCSRTYPRKGGPHFFFQTPPPPLHTWSHSPRSSGHPRPTMGQILLDPPGQFNPLPLGHVVNKTPSPSTGRKSACSPPSPGIISGTALMPEMRLLHQHMGVKSILGINSIRAKLQEELLVKARGYHDGHTNFNTILLPSKAMT